MTMKSIEELNKELLEKGLIAIIDGGIYSRVPEDELSKHIASFYGISIEELKKRNEDAIEVAEKFTYKPKREPQMVKVGFIKVSDMERSTWNIPEKSEAFKEVISIGTELHDPISDGLNKLLGGNKMNSQVNAIVNNMEQKATGIDMTVTPNSHVRDTTEHKRMVGKGMTFIVTELMERAIVHDNSKFSEAEYPYFSAATDNLKGMTYGSPEYKESLARIQPGIQHHYKVNSHHPEFYENGIEGMDLLDLVEMVCDWYAACMRHADGDIYVSLEKNRERFKINDQLHSIIKNTVDKLHQKGNVR